MAATLLAALLPIGAAQAAVTLSSGESALFNFDLTGATPGPTFSTVEIFYNWSDESGDSVFREFFAELDGGGSSVFSSTFFVASTVFVNAASNEPVRDGLFSMRVTATSGTFSLDPYAIGNSATGADTDPVYGTLSTVPAPATLALLGIGFAGLGIARRRKAQ